MRLSTCLLKYVESLADLRPYNGCNTFRSNVSNPATNSMPTNSQFQSGNQNRMNDGCDNHCLLKTKIG